MTIRYAEKKDIDAIMQIISQARESIGRLGIDQWQYGYPTRDIVRDDIVQHRGFVVEVNGEVVATFALMLDGEPTYKKIYCGSWSTEGRYVALHRLAVAPSHRGGELTGGIVEYICGLASEQGYVSVRVDTHEGNLPMRRMLERNGFERRGTIHLLDGQVRVAYERAV